MESPGIFTLAPPVQSFPLTNTAAGTIVIFTGRGRLYGWSARATATATGDLFDGPSATGQRIGSFLVDAAGRSSRWFGPNGIEVNSNLTLLVGVAAMTGCIYFQTETRINDWLVEIQNRSGVQYVTGNNWQGIASVAGE